MNLSALNPPQVNPPNNKVAETSVSGNEAVRLKSEALSGADFASYLHNQVQSLKHAQRPAFAVADKALPPPTAKNEARLNKDKPADEHGHDKSVDSDAHKAQQRQAAAKAAQADKSNDRTDGEEKVTDRQVQERIQEAKEAQISQQQAQLAAQEQTAQAVSDQMQAALVGGADPSNELGTDSDQANGLAAQNATLTTIAVSDKLQIITTANAAASEQSVADFALAMGLDPNQVKTLFGESAANAAAAKLAGSNPSTQQILGINSSPGLGLTADAANAVADGKSMAFSAQALVGSGLTVAMDGPVSTADFQTLQAQAPAITADAQDMLGKMENLQIQLGSAQAQITAGTASPASTLAVLSMMDTQLRAEDIEALKNEFDAVSTFDSLPAVGKDVNATPLSPLTNRPTALAQAPTAPAFANTPDMAQTYDKLSQKLTTELAARMHEKLNAGEWKMKFALKPASLGLVDVQLEMRDGKLSAHFQSDTHLTQDLLQNGSQRLKDALADLGMNNASVFVAQGQAQGQGAQGQGAQGQSARSGKFTQGNDNREKLSEESGLKIAGDKASRRDERSQFDSYA
jgi:flagellar hook-length control protein FliK